MDIKDKKNCISLFIYLILPIYPLSRALLDENEGNEKNTCDTIYHLSLFTPLWLGKRKNFMFHVNGFVCKIFHFIVYTVYPFIIPFFPMGLFSIFYFLFPIYWKKRYILKLIVFFNIILCWNRTIQYCVWQINIFRLKIYLFVCLCIIKICIKCNNNDKALWCSEINRLARRFILLISIRLWLKHYTQWNFSMYRDQHY